MLRRFLSRPETHLGVDGVLARGGDRATRLVLGERVLLSRALCHYEVIRSPAGANMLKVVKAARMAARARTPVADAAFYFDWQGDQLGVWSWPASIAEQLEGLEGDFLPETMLHPAGDDGPRLVEVMDGVEGQVWVGGRLIASRWWRRKPDERQWADFLRASRCAPAPVPEAVRVVRLEQPRSRPPLAWRIERVTSASSKDIAALALLLLLAPTLFLAGQWAHLSVERGSLQEELAELSAETSEIRQARQNAMTAAAQLNDYAQRLNHRHPAAILAEVTETFAAFNIRLEAFEQNETGLTVDLRSDATLAADELVRRMEASTLLSNVRIEPGRGAGDWTLIADLEPIS